jgi:small-conductance mechanosensitive channel
MRWLTVIAFLVIVLHAFELWDPLAKGVTAALRFEVALGAIRFTLGAGVTFALVLLAAALISRLLRFFLTAGLEERLAWQRGKSEAIGKIVHYAILTGGFFVALGASGIDLTKVTIGVGASGVGVGLGLQNVINNFVSGLILLFERPLHVGDKVTVGATSGEVSDIGIRASTIRTWDGADVVIPNGNLISGEFTNWTLTDDKRRSEIRVGVAYGAEPRRVMEILKGAACDHAQVLATPEPLVLFSGFGESSLDFVLYFWTLLGDAAGAASEIHGIVYDRLNAEGIEIPFPQREVLLKRPEGE